MVMQSMAEKNTTAEDAKKSTAEDAEVRRGKEKNRQTLAPPLRTSASYAVDFFASSAVDVQSSPITYFFGSLVLINLTRLSRYSFGM
jgi:hypothetical protein